MARKQLCIEAGVLPAVLATLVSEYAELTLNNRVETLFTRTTPGHIMLHTPRLVLQRGLYDSSRFSCSDRPLSTRGWNSNMMTIDEFCFYVEARYFRVSIKGSRFYNTIRSITDAEFADIQSWAAQVE